MKFQLQVIQAQLQAERAKFGKGKTEMERAMAVFPQLKAREQALRSEIKKLVEERKEGEAQRPDDDPD